MGSKKILLTGGLGYIGSHTALVLNQAGYEPIIIDNLSNAHKDKVLEGLTKISGKIFPFYEGDIRDKEILETIFDTHEILAVIHFAAKKAVGESCQDPFLYYNNNIGGSITLLETMMRYQVKSLIFSSSATVYDPIKNIPPFTENDRLNTTNPYGTTKLVIENILKDMSRDKGFATISLRYFNPIGAHISGEIGEHPKGIPTNILPYMLKVANKEIDKLQIFGDDYDTPDGSGVRDYIHVMDVADAHFKALEYLLERKNQSQLDEHILEHFWEVFNIGTGTGQSVKEIMKLVESVIDTKVQFEIIERRDGDVAISLANPEKARNILGWEAQRSIIQAIQDAWNFYQRNH